MSFKSKFVFLMVAEEEENEVVTDDNNSSVHTEPCIMSSVKVTIHVYEFDFLST